MTFDLNNKQLTTKLQNECTDALKAIADKYGLAVAGTGGALGLSSATLKFEFSKVTEGGEVLNQIALDFKRFCYSYGLQESDLGRTFRIYGTKKEYTITGARPKNTVYPIIATNCKGTPFKFSVDMIKEALARSIG